MNLRDWYELGSALVDVLLFLFFLYIIVLTSIILKNDDSS